MELVELMSLNTHGERYENMRETPRVYQLRKLAIRILHHTPTQENNVTHKKSKLIFSRPN